MGLSFIKRTRLFTRGSATRGIYGPSVSVSGVRRRSDYGGCSTINPGRRERAGDEVAQCGTGAEIERRLKRLVSIAEIERSVAGVPGRDRDVLFAVAVSVGSSVPRGLSTDVIF